MSKFTITLTLIVSLVAALLVTDRLGETVLDGLSLFLVVFLSILFGALIASVISVSHLVKFKWAMFGQRGKLKKSYQTTAELQQRVKELEGENSTLREQIKELSSGQ